MRRILALSIRQPYCEQILRGIKKAEYRSLPTNIRGQVYVYAALRPGHPDGFRKLKVQPGDLPTGVVVGVVEIVGCSGKPGDYAWHLANPKRLKRAIPPKNHPQPAWFYPF